MVFTRRKAYAVVHDCRRRLERWQDGFYNGFGERVMDIKAIPGAVEGC